MEYTKGYKFRLYPNKTQKTLSNKILGCCRFVYNHFLAVRKESWENEKKSVGYTQTSSMLTQLKKEISWLNEADSIALQQSLRNLDTAYQNFFKNDRGYPKFKSKKNHRQTYRTMGVRIEGKRIRLPKIGSIKFEQSREVHEKIVNAILDFLHNESTKICRENQTIAVESLQVKNLLRNHKLAKAISDVSWGEFFRQLTYKSILYGCDLIKIPTFYPSSQTCSNCGFQNPITKNLSARSWRYPKCGAYHDRDINAAKNILQKALSA